MRGRDGQNEWSSVLGETASLNNLPSLIQDFLGCWLRPRSLMASLSSSALV